MSFSVIPVSRKLILCDPMDYSVPGSSAHGILQGRILEWVLFSSPGDFPDLRIEHKSPALQVDSLPSERPGKPFKTLLYASDGDATSLIVCASLFLIILKTFRVP